MGLRQWIRENREEIDKAILSVNPCNRCNDEERELWVKNNEGLYLWAKAEGVRV